jgi:hypothetical protein
MNPDLHTNNKPALKTGPAYWITPTGVLLQPDGRFLRVASHDNDDEDFIAKGLSCGGGHAPVAA